MRRVLFVFLAALAWVFAGFLVSDVAQRWISLEDPHGRVNAALILPIALLILAGAIGLSAWVRRNWDLLGGNSPKKTERISSAVERKEPSGDCGLGSTGNPCIPR